MYYVEWSILVCFYSCIPARQLCLMEEERIMGPGSKLTSCASVNQLLTGAKTLLCCNSRISFWNGKRRNKKKRKTFQSSHFFSSKAETQSRRLGPKAKLLVNWWCVKLAVFQSIQVKGKNIISHKNVNGHSKSLKVTKKRIKVHNSKWTAVFLSRVEG